MFPLAPSRWLRQRVASTSTLPSPSKSTSTSTTTTTSTSTSESRGRSGSIAAAVELAPGHRVGHARLEVGLLVGGGAAVGAGRRLVAGPARRELIGGQREREAPDHPRRVARTAQRERVARHRLVADLHRPTVG